MSVLRRLRQEGLEFKASLGYIVRPCLQNKIRKKKEKRAASETMTLNWAGHGVWQPSSGLVPTLISRFYHGEGGSREVCFPSPPHLPLPPIRCARVPL
jgi:hypothetical protein